MVGLLKLSHFSVKEYLISSDIGKNFITSEQASHSKICKLSLVYLLQFDSYEPLTKNTLASFPLAEYSAETWVHHARSGVIDSVSEMLMLKLFTPPHTAPFVNWVRIFDISVQAAKYQELTRDVSKVNLPLYYACLAGLQDVVSWLVLEQKVDVNALKGDFSSPVLWVASLQGHTGIVKLLLENGANVNTEEGASHKNVLQAASDGVLDSAGIAKLLVEYGADVNAKAGVYGKALGVASNRGHEGIVKVLIEAGADVNSRAGNSTALCVAAAGGHEGVVKLLLENGANPDAPGGRHHFALFAAAFYGHESIVKLLVKYGADVNKGGIFGTALGAASDSYNWHEGIVNFLVENGAT